MVRPFIRAVAFTAASLATSGLVRAQTVPPGLQGITDYRTAAAKLTPAEKEAVVLDALGDPAVIAQIKKDEGAIDIWAEEVLKAGNNMRMMNPKAKPDQVTQGIRTIVRERYCRTLSADEVLGEETAQRMRGDPATNGVLERAMRAYQATVSKLAKQWKNGGDMKAAIEAGRVEARKIIGQ